MKRTFIYEIRKVCRQRSVIILLVILCALNVAFPFFASPAEEKSESYAEEYYKRIDNVIYDAQLNYRYVEDKNSPIALYQLGVEEYYSKLLERDVSGEVYGYDILLSSPIPYASALVITLFVAFTLSNADVSTNLVIATFKGKLCRIASEKILLTALVAVVVNVAAIMAASLGVGISVGYAGGDKVVASLPKYMYCPYDVTVIEAVALRVLVSAFVAFAMALFVHLLAFVTRKFVVTVAGVALLVGVDVLLTSVNTDFLDLYFNFNLISSLTDSILLRYSGVKFGVFLSRVRFEVLLLLVLSLLLTAALLYVYRTYKSVRTVKNKKKIKKTRAVSARRGLLGYEVKKLCSVRTFVIVLVMLVLECALIFPKTEMPRRGYDIAYKNYVTMMSEMTFDEQMTFSVETQNQAFADIEAGKEALELSKAGEIEYEEYIALVEKAGAAELIVSVFETIDEQLFSIAALRDEGVDATLVYATGWDILYNRGPDYILIITLLLILAPYAAEELDCGYERILCGSFRGRNRARSKFMLRKMTVMASSSAVIVTLFTLTELLLLDLRVGLPSWDKYAVGAGIMPHDLTLLLWQMVAGKFALSLLGTVLIILLLELLAQLKLKSIPAMLVVFVYSAVLAVISMLLGVYTSADLTSFYNYGVFSASILNISLQSVTVLVVVSAAAAVADLSGIYNN